MLQKGIQNGGQNHLKAIQKVAQNATRKKLRKSGENELILASFSAPFRSLSSSRDGSGWHAAELVVWKHFGFARGRRRPYSLDVKWSKMDLKWSTKRTKFNTQSKASKAK
jgi:hypothetical protein